MKAAIPDLKGLVDAVYARATHRHSELHGPHHWKCVAWTGVHLLPHEPEADPVVVFLFGLLHDSMRENDSHDPDHGRRAARLAEELLGKGYSLSPAQARTLQYACAEHADGRNSRDPTVGVCWDADRLNLWRVGMRPRAEYLSTAGAQSERRILWARELLWQELTWKQIFQAYAALPERAAARSPRR